jgi:hypothetical protein
MFGEFVIVFTSQTDIQIIALAEYPAITLEVVTKI